MSDTQHLATNFLRYPAWISSLASYNERIDKGRECHAQLVAPIRSSEKKRKPMKLAACRNTLLLIGVLTAVTAHASGKASGMAPTSGAAGIEIPLAGLSVENRPGPLAGPNNSIFVTSTVGTDHSLLSLASPTGALTTVHAFSPFVKDPVTGLQTNADGGYITDLQLGSDGNLYGVTDNGGSQGQGTMFRINPDGSFTTLNTFNFNITLPGLIADNEFIQGADGSFYGIAEVSDSDPNGSPYVYYRVTTSGQYTRFCSWRFIGGMFPPGPPTSLAAAPDGSIYGVLETGIGATSVVRLNQSTCAFDTVYAPPEPIGALLVGSDGSLYLGAKSVIKVSPDGTATTLPHTNIDEITTQVYKFGYWQFTDLGLRWVPGHWITKDAAISATGFGGTLSWGPDGDLYLLTSGQGLNGHGTIIRINPDGSSAEPLFAPLNQVFGRDHPIAFGTDGKLRMVENSAQSTSIMETVNLNSPLTTSISFSNPTVSLGQKTVLSWSSAGATSCQLISDIPFVAKSSVAASGSKAVHIYSTDKRSPASFTAGLQCTAADGSVSNSAATVTVN